MSLKLTSMGKSCTIRPRVDNPTDATQKNCTHGFVLPDRCRYNPRLGCDCGEYKPLTWNAEKHQYE